MKFLTVFFLSLSITAAANGVEPKKLAGLWYEIARTYNDYEKNCVAATVEYRLVGSDTFDVINRCFDKHIGGDLITYNATAKTLQQGSADRLKLTYYLVFTREYSLIEYDKNGEYAVMASPDHEQLWIMSRTPTLKKEQLTPLLSKLASRIDTRKLIFTPQDQKGRYQ